MDYMISIFNYRAYCKKYDSTVKSEKKKGYVYGIPNFIPLCYSAGTEKNHDLELGDN